MQAVSCWTRQDLLNSAAAERSWIQDQVKKVAAVLWPCFEGPSKQEILRQVGFSHGSRQANISML